MNKLSLLALVGACGCGIGSPSEGSTVAPQIAIDISDSVGALLAYPDGTWEFQQYCELPDGHRSAYFNKGTWSADATQQYRGFARDAAFLAFAAPVAADGTCPQGRNDIFEMLLPDHTPAFVCWKSDPSNPAMPSAIIGLEKMFDAVVVETRTEAAGKACPPLLDDATVKMLTMVNLGRDAGASVGGSAPIPFQKP